MGSDGGAPSRVDLDHLAAAVPGCSRRMPRRSGTPWSSVPGRERIAGTARIPARSRGTGNRQLSEVESYLDVHLAAEQPGDVNLRDFRAFLRALTVPPKGTEGVPVTALPGCCTSGRTSSPSSASSAA